MAMAGSGHVSAPLWGVGARGMGAMAERLAELRRSGHPLSASEVRGVVATFEGVAKGTQGAAFRPGGDRGLLTWYHCVQCLAAAASGDSSAEAPAVASSARAAVELLINHGLLGWVVAAVVGQGDGRTARPLAAFSAAKTLRAMASLGRVSQRKLLVELSGVIRVSAAQPTRPSSQRLARWLPGILRGLWRHRAHSEGAAVVAPSLSSGMSSSSSSSKQRRIVRRKVSDKETRSLATVQMCDWLASHTHALLRLCLGGSGMKSSRHGSAGTCESLAFYTKVLEDTRDTRAASLAFAAALAAAWCVSRGGGDRTLCSLLSDATQSHPDERAAAGALLSELLAQEASLPSATLGRVARCAVGVLASATWLQQTSTTSETDMAESLRRAVQAGLLALVRAALIVGRPSSPQDDAKSTSVFKRLASSARRAVAVALAGNDPSARVFSLYGDDDERLLLVLSALLSLGAEKSQDFPLSLSPHRLAHRLLKTVAFEPQVLLDWLITGEAQFLSYATVYAKYAAKNPRSLREELGAERASAVALVWTALADRIKSLLRKVSAAQRPPLVS